MGRSEDLSLQSRSSRVFRYLLVSPVDYPFVRVSSSRSSLSVSIDPGWVRRTEGSSLGPEVTGRPSVSFPDSPLDRSRDEEGKQVGEGWGLCLSV